MRPLVDYLQNPSSSVDRKVRLWTLKFVLDDGDYIVGPRMMCF
jgi:hypothetical protein